MHSTSEIYAFIHGEFIPLSKAFLHVGDLSVQRGYGIFDFFKVEDGHPLFLDDYLLRFYQSAKMMELPVIYSKDELKAKIYELIQKNNFGTSGIKMILTGGYSANGYDPAEPNFIMIQQPLALPGQEVIAKGLKIITHAYVREIPAAKTINYTMGVRLIKEIKAQEAQDVLYQRNSEVTELPRCNFFIVKQDDTIVTPSQDVLYGVTRKNVLELASKKYKVEEGTVTLADIKEAKEAFLTSTTKRILPVVQVGANVIGNGKPGAITLSLLDELITLEEQHLTALVKG
ncbi:aminotransferase class IV [Pontibacter harenae]|uniref:aminotransferase class IV n=1 Tax=Pontibacter harenae TaxID=2894083 RepID=UPI001E3BCE30|nr:aminotransferase class IV [Pontibacter harenae]MCC9166972.1 aminotransferase class IV [Pontibacter harenae]